MWLACLVKSSALTYMFCVFSGHWYLPQERPQGPSHWAQVARYLFATTCEGKLAIFFGLIFSWGWVPIYFCCRDRQTEHFSKVGTTALPLWSLHFLTQQTRRWWLGSGDGFPSNHKETVIRPALQPVQHQTWRRFTTGDQCNVSGCGVY